MSDSIIEISSPEIVNASAKETVRGGHTRMVPMVPLGKDGGFAPCIWKSHYQIPIIGNKGERLGIGHEALLLICRQPLQTLRAEIATEAWANFHNGPVEW